MSSTPARFNPELSLSSHSNSISDDNDISLINLDDLHILEDTEDVKPLSFFNKFMSESKGQDGVGGSTSFGQATSTTPVMSTVAAPNFAVLLKAVPLKLDGIIKLVADGSNFDLWEADFKEFLTFIPDAIRYLHHTAVPTAKGFSNEMANGVNSIMHWTIDRQLAMRIRKGNPCPSVRMDELRRLFSGVSYANRLSLLSQLTSLKYDGSSGTVDSFFAQATNIRDRLELSGMFIPDDVYGGILALAVPNDFPDIAHTFEASLLADPKHVISSSSVMRVINAGDVSYRRSHPTGAEAMKANVSDGKKDSRTCHYCQKVGHIAKECRKKLKEKKEGKEKATVQAVTMEEAEAKEVDIGYTA